LYFENSIDAHFQFVPYRGTPQVLQDVLAGQIDLLFDQLSSSLPLVRSGKVKAYGVTAKSRLASAPDIATMDEGGLPGLYASIWFGLWAPRDTPRSIVNRLNAAVVDSLADQGVRARLASLGLVRKRLRERREATFLLRIIFVERHKHLGRRRKSHAHRGP
jgi:tripartite-type tricarboxylate transporter receptor subunit TctC